MTNRERFEECRRRLWALLAKVDFSNGCKSYEGLIEIVQTYPSYFHSPDKLPEPESVIIRLHCYVLGDFRHYVFMGKTYGQAIDDFERWLTEQEETEEE